MCKCSPRIRTPFCGRPGCEWPKQEKDEELIFPSACYALTGISTGPSGHGEPGVLNLTLSTELTHPGADPGKPRPVFLSRQDALKWVEKNLPSYATPTITKLEIFRPNEQI